MAQATDFTIANQSFPNFRTDLNTVLGAINSSNSGTSRPSSATTGTFWLDTSSSGSNLLILKFFDGSDDITFATFNTSSNTVDVSDSASDLVGDTTPQLGGNLDTNSSNIQFDDAHGITDDSDNEQLIFQKTSSAVNFLEITNQATGSNPSLSANGDDTNVGLEFSTKGTGAIKFNDLAYVPQQALTSSSNAVAWDTQAKPNAYHLTTENTTFSAPTNSVEGSFICLEINYNGSHTIAFNTAFEFAASTAPTFTSTDGKTDILVFKYNGSVWQEVGRTLNLSES
tara:strand:- start:3109 stop:3960 length:852 start_codon:yes stop_codon:yes gene_type:complete